jgi:leucyl aminopeptidase
MTIKRRNIIKSVWAVLLLALFGSSSVDRTVVVFGGVGVWSADGRQFHFRDSELDLARKDGRILVMVSFTPGSHFLDELRSGFNLLGYYSSLNSGVGRAVVQVDSPADVDQLAMKAHEDIGACGAVEIYNPELTETTLGEASSPVIATSVKTDNVSSLLTAVSAENLRTTVTTLENLGTRHHSASSTDVSAVVQSLWQPLLPSGASLSYVAHPGYTQKSVVLKIPGTDLSGETIVVGAHLDSINPSNNQNAPGADDDASGIAALTEVLKVIKSSGATFNRPIELHAYAAEEVGLVGSQGIVTAATTSGQQVAAMLQLDMIGYSADQGDQTIHLITTDTSPVLVRHLKDLMSSYLGTSWQASELNSGTSDHRSWHRGGFHAAFTFENPQNYNRALHTDFDQSSRLNFDFAARFTKLTLAFLSHEAGLTSAITQGSESWAQQQETSSSVKLALSKSKAGGFRLSAAVSKALNAQTAEICRVSKGQELGCQSLVTSAMLAKSQFEKTFFVSGSDMTLASGDLWRFHLYDAAGGLVAVRTVKLRSN